MIRKKDDRVYAGGSKYFNERTGKYEMPPGIKPPVKPGKPGKPSPVKPNFGKMLGQQPITMGTGYKNEINQIRPIGNGSAMNKQYRAQGGGRFI